MTDRGTAAAWRKSARCESASACVEVAEFEGEVGMRNSTQPDLSITFPERDFKAFIAGVKAGEFDL